MPLKTLNYKTADRFVEALSPTGELLGGASIDQLVFRGHGSADWSLLPSILRGSVAPSNAAQVGAEATALRDFLAFADRQGLAIPGDSDELRNEINRAADDGRFLHVTKVGRAGVLDEPAWPQRNMRALMAIAQHHGLRTRMLDWTRHPLIAAYFAGVAAASSTSPSALAVVVFDLEKSRAVRRLHHQGTLEPVTIPYATNRNAHAQQGLFTVETRVTFVADGAVDVTSIEDWFASTPDEGNPLLKVILPASEAGRLLGLLARHNISAATMFPGYDGAARAVREKWLWK